MIPVVLDTDIGLDVDDVWALALLLRCPELDLRLVLSSTGDTEYGAAVAAKLLTIANRTDVPVAVGVPLLDTPKTHAPWLDGFGLHDYQGTVLPNGVGALLDIVAASPQPVTVISIGPMGNLAAALAVAPEIVRNIRLVGMHGSIYRGYRGAAKPAREYNVRALPAACQAVIRSGVATTLTPLDTCGDIVLQGEHFAALRASTDPLVGAVIDNHDLWCREVADWPVMAGSDPLKQSSILFDTVAVYLGFSESGLEVETCPLRVTDDGKTLLDAQSPDAQVRCALQWEKGAQERFSEFVVARLLGQDALAQREESA